MKYQSLTIENFRGIKKLKIDDLKRVNLLVGRNNCGKTSVLEAAFMLSGMSTAIVPIQIQSFRELKVVAEKDILSLFKELDPNKQIFLEGNLDNKQRSLTIEPFYTDDNAQDLKKHKVHSNYVTSTVSERLIQGIKLDCRDNKNNLIHRGRLYIKRQEEYAQVSSSYKETLKCLFLPSKMFIEKMIRTLNDLMVEKKLDPIISVLQKIEPNITDIRIGAKNIIYIDVGGNNLLPINIMGDGMIRILTFLTSLADTKNGVVLIDEIENGLHYSSMNIAWNAILTACKAYNVQLIATTHSYEAIEALSNAYAEIEPQGDDIRLYRLDKDGENHKAYSASARALEAGIEKDFEVR
ncbi:MAG: ATP/GTP-binding protein [Deltaproteobacteria bacterium]|nr:ATP/GTP-binding protein [Deltaproteobacteria bacterium]